MAQSKIATIDWVKKVQSAATQEESMTIYDEIASNYDKDVPLQDKPDPAIVAKELAALFEDKKDVRILDVAAGTGYVGCELHKLGFANVDALDCSTSMLEIAKKKNCYKNYYCSFFTKDPTEGLTESSYDALVSTGSFSPGHLKADCFLEFIRLAKSEGYIIIGVSEGTVSYKDANDVQCLQEVITSCANSKLCQVIEIWRYEEYNHEGLPGVVFVVKKL